MKRCATMPTLARVGHRHSAVDCVSPWAATIRCLPEPTTPATGKDSQQISRMARRCGRHGRMHSPEHLWISGTLKFSRDPVIANECRLEGPANQSTPLAGSCACTHASGETTECAIAPMAGTGTTNCCESKPPFDVELKFNTRATPCAEVCVVTDPGLGHYCEELR